MKKIIILTFILTLISCSRQSKIYYEYDGLVVTRFTDYPKDFFFIGKHQNISDTLNSTFIKSSFSGFNSSMDAYMVFRPDRTIDIIRLDASFEKFGTNDSINLKDFENNIDFIKWEDNAKLDFKNIIRLSDVLELEKKRNLKNKTEVLTSYEN